MRVFHITIIVGLAICLGAANAQKKTAKKASDAHAYEDYDDYDAAEDDPTTATATGAGAGAKQAASGSSTTTTTPPTEEVESSKGLHPFFKNRLRLKARPSPHPAIKVKPTLPSFIKHPANIEDLGHEVPHEQKATQAPLPRPKATTTKPVRFSSTANRRKPVTKEQPKEDYDYEETAETKPSNPKPSSAPKPLRPRGRQ